MGERIHCWLSSVNHRAAMIRLSLPSSSSYGALSCKLHSSPFNEQKLFGIQEFKVDFPLQGIETNAFLKSLFQKEDCCKFHSLTFQSEESLVGNPMLASDRNFLTRMLSMDSSRIKLS